MPGWCVRCGKWMEGSSCEPCREELEAERERATQRLEVLLAPMRCLAPGCKVVFLPERPGRLYCSPACRTRAWRARHRDPSVAA